VQTLKTSEAAALLNVSPNTLRAWERRFGYPKPQRSPGKHRLYAFAEIAALREALEDGCSISSAVSVASEALSSNAHALCTAITCFHSDEADDVMEGSLALRSLERSLDEVMLPALGEVRRRKGGSSAVWAFAAGWAHDWLRRAQRVAPPGMPGGPHILVGDASAGELDPSSPYIRSVTLCCQRAGGDVLLLPVIAAQRLSEATSALEPDIVVIAGQHAGDEAIARWAYAVRSSAGPIPFLLYHRGLDDRVGGARRPLLPAQPIPAQMHVFTVFSEQLAGSSQPRPFRSSHDRSG
jgi:MerR family transcriptional regulator, light-induced transcriptional regulator